MTTGRRRLSIENRNDSHSSTNAARQLAALVDHYGPSLVLYTRQICDEVEDVVQEAFVEFIEQQAPPDNVRAWLFRVVRNRALDRVRSAHRRQKNHKAVSSGKDWLPVSVNPIDGKPFAYARDGDEATLRTDDGTRSLIRYRLRLRK